MTSKLWNNKHHPDDMEPELRKTLSDLGLDYVDLYLVHWPHAYKRGEERFPADADGNRIFDFNLHPTETYLAMERFVDEGLVRSLGLSNFHAKQVDDIVKRAVRHKPVVNQVECHPKYNQAKLLAYCEERGVKLQAYSPLGSPARSWAPVNEVKLFDEPIIVEIAKRLGKTTAQILLKFQVSVILMKSLHVVLLGQPDWNL